MKPTCLIVGIAMGILLGTPLYAQEATPEPPLAQILPVDALKRACSADELEQMTAIVAGPAVNFAGFEALDTENEIQIAQLAAAYDVLAFGQWHELLPTLPPCAEAFYFGTALGHYYEQNALLNIFNRVARIYRSFGEMETTARYAQLIRDQRQAMDANAPALIETLHKQGVLPELEVEPILPTCTPAQQNETSDLLRAVVERYGETGNEVDVLLDEDRMTLLEHYNAFAKEYWDDAFTELPACAEAIHVGWYVGHTINSTVIAIALTDALLMEAQYGNDQMTALFADRLALRTNAIAGDVALFLAPLTGD